MFGELCVRCKGRLWCGLSKCPLLESAKDYMPKLRVNPSELFGLSPPSLFVGRYGYPKVYAGPLVSESTEVFSTTSELYGKPLDHILARTSSLLRVSAQVDVKNPQGKIVEATQELAMSVKPLDTEVKVEKIANMPSLDTFFHPTGPRVIARRVDVVDNPSIPRKVDMTVEERMKANTAIRELYRYGYPVDYLQRLMAAGVLGQQKKLVPTRWSITAVDDAVAKALLRELRHEDSVDKVEYYSGAYMGNEFHILFIPGVWEYEMIETWLRGSIYSPTLSVTGEDYEPFNGRKDYASNITGAYYAARLAVLETLHRRRRQARVLIYREITPEYKIPLGVWVIRETVRDAVSRKPLIFEDVELALSTILKKVNNKKWTEKSRLLYNLKHQRRLEDFL
ncbi:MAG: hypothetical protein GXO25_05405 [Euryarchaeota archaeon]|nr:hypothetical protein [Euryarchaeota archaeon]